MSNLFDPAFPIFNADGETNVGDGGLTKHELAAVIIGGHLTSMYEHDGRPTSKQVNVIAEEAYNISKAILNKFNPTT